MRSQRAPSIAALGWFGTLGLVFSRLSSLLVSFLCLLLLQGECNCIAGHWLEKRHLPITSLITARAECYGNCLFAGHLPSSITGFLEQAQAFLDACHPSGGVQPHGISIRSQCSVVTTLFFPSLFFCNQIWNRICSTGTFLWAYESCSELSSGSGTVGRMPVGSSACNPCRLGWAVALGC